MKFKNDLLPNPDTVLYDLVPELREWIGWFRCTDDDEPEHLYQARRWHEVWEAHLSPDYTWMGQHPWAPHWVKEVLLQVRAEPIDIYEGVVIVELLRLLDLAESVKQPSRSLADYVASGTDIFDEVESMRRWLCSSDHRKDYLWQSIGDHTSNQATQSLPEALSVAMARERGTITKRTVWT